jgi:dTMP kinase
MCNDGLGKRFICTILGITVPAIFLCCRSGKAAAPSGSGLFARHRRAFQGVRMANAGSKSGRGALVVLEGLDRSGKSSQCARLLSYLESQGCRAEGWRFPDRGTSVGQMISAYLANESQLDDRTIHLLFSANRWEKRCALLTMLQNCLPTC